MATLLSAFRWLLLGPARQKGRIMCGNLPVDTFSLVAAEPLAVEAITCLLRRLEFLEEKEASTDEVVKRVEKKLRAAGCERAGRD